MCSTLRQSRAAFVQSPLIATQTHDSSTGQQQHKHLCLAEIFFYESTPFAVSCFHHSILERHIISNTATSGPAFLGNPLLNICGVEIPARTYVCFVYTSSGSRIFFVFPDHRSTPSSFLLYARILHFLYIEFVPRPVLRSSILFFTCFCRYSSALAPPPSRCRFVCVCATFPGPRVVYIPRRQQYGIHPPFFFLLSIEKKPLHISSE